MFHPFLIASPLAPPAPCWLALAFCLPCYTTMLLKSLFRVGISFVFPVGLRAQEAQCLWEELDPLCDLGGHEWL